MFLNCLPELSTKGGISDTTKNSESLSKGFSPGLKALFLCDLIIAPSGCSNPLLFMTPIKEPIRKV